MLFMSQLVDLVCLLKNHKNRIVPDYRCWENQIDLPSLHPAIFLSIKCLCDWDGIFPTAGWGGTTFSPILQEKTEAQTGFSKLAKVTFLNRGSPSQATRFQTPSAYPQPLPSPSYLRMLYGHLCVNKKREKSSNSQFYLTGRKTQQLYYLQKWTLSPSHFT